MLVSLWLAGLIAAGCTRGGPPTSEDTNAELLPLLQRNVVRAEAAIPGGGLEFSRAANVRYIGELQAGAGRRIKPLRLFRSGHLALVNDDGYAEMRRLGIRTIVDFRSAAEVRAVPDAPWVVRGIHYVNLGVADAPPNSASAYVQMLRALEPRLSRLFSELGRKDALPALLHCGTGRGRACAGMAVVLLALGVSRADVAVDFADNQSIGIDPKWLDGVLAWVEEAGGIRSYLRRNSVSDADVESLIQQATEPQAPSGK